MDYQQNTEDTHPSKPNACADTVSVRGYSNQTIMETLGIKNVTQIKRWMNWYHTNQNYRFQQPVGEQYS